MTAANQIIKTLEAVLSGLGLAVRGGFNFSSGAAAPHGTGIHPAQSLLLVGNIGADFWPHFEAWRAAQPDGPNPLDRWTRSLINSLARAVHARAIFPSDWPYQPFQQWAMRVEGLQASPLGLLIHPDYGLWHAYRAALLFDAPLDLDAVPNRAFFCDACVGKPCLRACPIGAHWQGGFDYEGCKGWQRAPQGQSCRSQGCLDRNACPVWIDYRYPPALQAFLADAFVGDAL